jgi:hypothetical protein
MTDSARWLRACTLAALAVASLSLLACGRRGPPVPPRRVAPAAVESFRAEPGETDILVSWVRPSRNEDGSPLIDLAEFRLSRAVGTPGLAGLAARPAFSLLATIRAQQPDNAAVRENQYIFRDDGGAAGLAPGIRYAYRVEAVNSRGVVGRPSAEAFVDFSLAPAAPTGLQAAAGDSEVNLSWKPPAEPVPAGPAPAGTPSLRGYNVYRGLQPQAYGSEPINAVPLTDPRFRDAGLTNETTYYYVVRSAAGERPPWRESTISNETAATPMDLAPPGPPRGLVAVPSAGAIGLIWDANPEVDLLGYLVYRREPPAVTPARLTQTPIQTTTFTDRTARPGVSYLYTVTAVDRSPRQNESPPSAEVSATLP